MIAAPESLAYKNGVQAMYRKIYNRASHTVEEPAARYEPIADRNA